MNTWRSLPVVRICWNAAMEQRPRPLDVRLWQQLRSAGRQPPMMRSALFNAPTADQVRALAPDASAARSGEGLANVRHWTGLGRSGRAIWGLCQGSGANPYQVAVDMSGPAFKCTCPSRKIPCKHALGILLLNAANATALPNAEPPSWAADWLASRDTRASAAQERAAKGPAEVDEVAQAKRAEARTRKVEAGLEEFDRWLRDLMRRGLVAARSEGYGYWDAAGARLVDAQAPALGRGVRALGGISSGGPAWGERALEHAARLHLVVEGHRRLADLPEPLAADVRTLVGWTVREDDLPQDAGVTDRWLAVGRAVTGNERITTARTWLLGEGTGRWALHLAFSPGDVPPTLVAVGGSFEGTIDFYPSATPLRGRVRDGALPGPSVTSLPHGVAIGAAAAVFTEVLAANPFVESWPVVLRDVVPAMSGDRLVVRDMAGNEAASVPVTPGRLAARLLAVAGGLPITIAGTWGGRSVRLLSAVVDGRVVDVSTDAAGDGFGDESAGAPAVASGDPAWERLVSTALLGTERLGGERGGDVDTAFDARDLEAALLGSAAVVSLRRRAGWMPPVVDEPLPPAADPDPRPVVGRVAAWHLRQILDERVDLLGEWLLLAGPTGRRPPDEELPRLLAVAARVPSIREALAPLLGPRATWLAAAFPELAFGLGAARPAQDRDPAAAFEAETDPAARIALIETVRATDPDRARTLAEAAWDDSTVDERVRLVEILASNPTQADEPLLERARTDRRQEVRVAAAQVLARISGSAFARLAEETARPLLATAGRLRPSLDVSLPAWDDRLDRLVVIRKPPQGMGERAWWLRQLVERVDPARWTAWLDTEPKAIIERALRNENSRALIEALVTAASRFEDARWAAALLSAEAVRDPDMAPGVDVLDLLAVLPDAQRQVTVARLLADADTDLAARLAASCPRPWSPELSQASLAALARDVPSAFPPPGFYALVRLAARRMPPEFADDLETVLTRDERRSPSETIIDAIDIVRTRLQMAEALKEHR
jgi:hypothetical protein